MRHASHGQNTGFIRDGMAADLHLNSFAEILTHTLSFNNMLIDLAGCDVVVPGKCGQKISFIIAEIEIHFLCPDENHVARKTVSDTYTAIYVQLAIIIRSKRYGSDIPSVT